MNLLDKWYALNNSTLWNVFQRMTRSQSNFVFQDFIKFLNEDEEIIT